MKLNIKKKFWRIYRIRKEEEQDIKNIDKNLDVNIPNPINTNYKSIIKNK